MNKFESAAASPIEVLDRYRTIGLIGGGFLGALIGIMVSGPHFREWGLSRLAWTMGGSFVVGLVLGFLAGQLAAGSSAGCDASGTLFSSHDGHSGDVGGSCVLFVSAVPSIAETDPR